MLLRKANIVCSLRIACEERQLSIFFIKNLFVSSLKLGKLVEPALDTGRESPILGAG